ncbi:MAG: 30S ribosomal protein S6 [Opitutales bacterium]
MTTTTQKTYKTTFILDTRGVEEPVETLIDQLKGVLEGIGATVKDTHNVGNRTFARVPDRKFPEGIFLQITFEAGPEIPAQLSEKLRLDKKVNRIMTEKI